MSIYTEVFTLYVVQSVGLFITGFWVCVLLRKGEPFIVYKALSFPFSHIGLGHRDSVKCLLSLLYR